MKLMVQIGDEIIPLAQCFWIRTSPDGCVCSSSHGDTAITAADAHKDFTPRQRDRDRELKAGWTIRLVTRKQWDEQAAPCIKSTCEHRKQAAA
ncbi:hypothetical protein GCM10010275_19520 [Streptomyces litmocidini]|uniref:hypothetical protein n=1 Tax=Streptomyces litmocidini TaxID=67318 RepID=UPI00167E25E1|nr:hypothetical protein [Streptomyces litmocidini]GGU84559.1 hypothetical protein GCM10010275_19520 [Streptomyces litmocidini]